MMRWLSLLTIITAVSAYSAPNTKLSVNRQPLANKVNAAAKAAATAALALVLTASPVHADSSTAAHITLDSLPPTTVKIAINDLPVVGSLVSGTYTKVPDDSVSKPSVTIKSPQDKVAAVKNVATGGHLEFDVDGILGTHLDVDIAADNAGIATVRVASPLIPKLPFKNLASSSPKLGNKASEWSSVTNLGNGESYYFNEKTGITQYTKPESI